jgi:hypothetical protein
MSMVNLQIIAGDFEALGLDLPTDVAEVFDVWAALREPIDASPGVGLRAELAAGTLTVANAAERIRQDALTLSLRTGMQSLLVDLERPATIRAMAAFAADADRVVAELAPRFTEAAATVLEGLAHFTPAEYGDPGRLLLTRPGAAAHYHPTTQAGGVLDLIAGVVNAIRPLASPVSGYVTLTDEAGAETLSAAQSAYAAGSPLRWVSLFATAGLTPSLNTQAEAAQVVAKGAELGRTRDAEAKDRGVRRARKAEPWLVS